MTILKGNVPIAGLANNTIKTGWNLFDCKWADHLLDNLSWLRADTFSWQNGTTYSIAYNELLSEYNNASSTTEIDGKSWTQPVLSANGTMGGSSFAVSASSDTSGSKPAYYAFDNNSSTFWRASTKVGYIDFYNPIPLKVTNIKWVYFYNYPTGGNVQGSNDYSTWDTIKIWTNSSASDFNIDLSDNTQFYKYYRLNITGTGGYDDVIHCPQLTITAVQQALVFKRTPKGYKIADASQETAILNKYTSDGIAWYYILDTANTRFKLPRTKFGFEGLRGNVGDDIAESLPNIKGEVSVRRQNSDGTLCYTGGVFYDGGLQGASDSIYYSVDTTSQQQRIKLDASLSSSTYQNNAPVQERATQMYLYFYVGEYSQTAIEQTAGITSEQLNAKMDLSLLSVIYPVGSIYIGTQATCPMATLITGSTWELVSDGRVLQGSDSTHQAGTTIAAGLPNISGWFGANVNDGDNWGGAFYLADWGNNGADGSDGGGHLGFTASNCSSIYGNSSTVQPPAYVVNIWRRTA